MEQITSAALSEYGVVVAALCGVAVYLFKALEKSVQGRIAALESGLDNSLKKHEECERRNAECEARSTALSKRVAVLERAAGVP